MAALIKHVLSKVPQRLSVTGSFNSRGIKRWKPKNPEGPQIHSIKSSIANRGFLRQVKEYNPPDKVKERFQQLVDKIYGSKVSTGKIIETAEKKFMLLNECFKEFNHGIPNSLLHTISTIGDVQKFYETPVVTTTPLDLMKNLELPPNLHVNYEPVRFHPETDTMFGGKTAFPKSSTLVTGIRTRKKYKSYIIPDAPR
uniref:Large ribosomal subunit protein mL50 n=1 Tax=Clastoptera arizonana TaxID=38151 RepID=A0A1B6BYY2_9HEMI